MRFIINADDYGLSRGITDKILDAFDHGALSGTSIIANGNAFDYAIAEYKKREGLRLSVHLNLVEGRPILPWNEVSMLTNDEGFFCHTFQALWWHYLKAASKERAIFREQIRKELTAQICRVQQCFDRAFKINIDSHLHYHLLPFVFEILIDLHHEFRFSYIRLPQERFFFIAENFHSLKNYVSLNPLKNGLLNFLSMRNRKLILENKIDTCAHFVGVLFSGKMTESVVRSALSKIRFPQDNDQICEILFHPGRALESEQGMRSAHYSPWRQTEFETLKSDSFQRFVKTLQN
ncbi:MAG: ChbG/HpnK family deacetylase [SAR324 cluster bacterium]|nr:ChbG/HpnK family deacetylase [SAR324 cluster bacterium]